MQYAQLNEALTEAIQVTSDGDIEWDSRNFCTAAALVKDGKAEQFRVVPLQVIAAPKFNPDTQIAVRDGCEKIGNEWRYKWRIDQLSTEQAAIKLAAARLELVKKIDADVDFIYGIVQGNRGPEYILAEAEATAFKQGGYVGSAPPSVASWAYAKSWTPTQAADDILATAAGWRSAQSAIRATRLSCKEAARTANDLTAVNMQWATFLINIRIALGIES